MMLAQLLQFYMLLLLRDNYILLFKDLLLIMQAQALLRVIMCYLMADISLGIKRPTLDKWLEIGMLGNQTAYYALNTSQAFIDKAKTLCLQFSNSVLLLKKGNLLVSTLAALVIRFIIIMTFKCLKQHIINNFIITKSVYCFLFNGK